LIKLLSIFDYIVLYNFPDEEVETINDFEFIGLNSFYADFM